MKRLTEVRREPGTKTLKLTWEDGFEAELAWELVRGYCPCALCQGHGAGEVVYHPPKRPADPTTIEPVGNYAISIGWSDGHATGIYRFDFLRELTTKS